MVSFCYSGYWMLANTQLHTPARLVSTHLRQAADYCAEAPPRQVNTLLAPKADVNTDTVPCYLVCCSPGWNGLAARQTPGQTETLFLLLLLLLVGRFGGFGCVTRHGGEARQQRCGCSTCSQEDSQQETC
jgi:hypothetical protein